MRRSALVRACREVWCQQGWAAVTMRGVCAHAGLTDRYFYESFADRDELLVAVGDEVRAEVLSVILEAVAPHVAEPPLEQLRAALTAVIDFISSDPGGTQIFFGDHGGNDVLAVLRRRTINAVVELFVEIASPRLLPGVRETDFRVTLLVGIGGFVEAATAWRSGELEVTADELVETLLGVGRRMGSDLVALDEVSSERPV